MKDLTAYLGALPDADLSALEPALRNTQGNTLKAFGGDFAAYGFVRFSGTVPAAGLKAGLRSVAQSATSLWDQMEPKRERARIPVRCSVGLSASGLATIGVKPEATAGNTSFERGFAGFTANMQRQTSGWTTPFDGKARIDALVTLAGYDPAVLAQKQDELAGDLAGLGAVAWVPGFVKRTNGRPMEHFGFVDGISQPLFLESQLKGHAYSKDTWPEGLPEGMPRWVLRKELDGPPANYGSFLVFLKLEQDVAAFRGKAGNLARALRGDSIAPSTAEREHAQELIFGREKDGTPLVDPRAISQNIFDYSKDPNGVRCPLGAHIRKMNPRTADLRARRIARRSMLYDDGKTRGVLFQCYQSDIFDQFEFLFRDWGNSVDAPQPGGGIDPLIGLPANASIQQQWPKKAGDPNKVSHELDSLVTVRGGEYFYMPSIGLLQRL